MGVGPPNHHAIIYCCEANSRRAALAPAQSRTNLGHISVSSYYTKQFSLPHHAQHIQPYPSHRWTGQILLVESPPIPAHPAPIPWRFSGCQINTQTTQSCNSPLPVSPPPTDLHTGSGRDSPPILNSLPTHTSSTVPTPSTSPVLQEPFHVTITQPCYPTPHRFYTPISLGLGKINLAFPRIQAGVSAV